jgi:hypothetical protein
MIGSRSPEEVVRVLVGVINGDLPRVAAAEILDPRVQIWMDSANHCGINNWYKWVYLIRNCGRISELRMTHCEMRPDSQQPHLIHLSTRWAGTERSQGVPRTAQRDAQLRYLVQDGVIRKIWTRKSNYDFIFGPWVRYSAGYRLLLAWAVVYFSVLSLRRKDFRDDLG